MTTYPSPEQVERLMSLHERLGNRPSRYRHEIIVAVSHAGSFTAEKIEGEIERLTLLAERTSR
jgi:predicted DNA-binding protein